MRPAYFQYLTKVVNSAMIKMTILVKVTTKGDFRSLIPTFIN